MSRDIAAQPQRWDDADGVHIDVRGLACPQPLTSIVALVESLGDAAVVIVHHDRDPMLLYPELAERGCVVVPAFDDPQALESVEIGQIRRGDGQATSDAVNSCEARQLRACVNRDTRVHFRALTSGQHGGYQLDWRVRAAAP